MCSKQSLQLCVCVRVAMYCRELQCACCSVLQCVAVSCSKLQLATESIRVVSSRCSPVCVCVMQCVAASVLQCVAVCCIELQCACCSVLQ